MEMTHWTAAKNINLCLQSDCNLFLNSVPATNLIKLNSMLPEKMKGVFISTYKVGPIRSELQINHQLYRINLNK